MTSSSSTKEADIVVPQDAPVLFSLYLAFESACRRSDIAQIHSVFKQIRDAGVTDFEVMQTIEVCLSFCRQSHWNLAFDLLLAMRPNEELYLLTPFLMFLGQRLLSNNERERGFLAYQYVSAGQEKAASLAAPLRFDHLAIEELYQGRVWEWARAQVEADPEDAEAWLILAHLQQMADEDEACESYLRAFMLDSSFREAGYQALSSLREFGREDEIPERLEALRDAFPNDPRIFLWEAEYDDEEGRWKDAIKKCQMALVRKPDDIMALEALFLYQMEGKEWGQAAKTLETWFFAEPAPFVKRRISGLRLSLEDEHQIPISSSFRQELEANREVVDAEEAWYRRHLDHPDIGEQAWRALRELLIDSAQIDLYVSLILEEMRDTESLWLKGKLLEGLLVNIDAIFSACPWGEILYDLREQFNETSDSDVSELGQLIEMMWGLIDRVLETLPGYQNDEDIASAHEDVLNWSEFVEFLLKRARRSHNDDCRDLLERSLYSVYKTSMGYSDAEAERLCARDIPLKREPNAQKDRLSADDPRDAEGAPIQREGFNWIGAFTLLIVFLFILGLMLATKN